MSVIEDVAENPIGLFKIAYIIRCHHEHLGIALFGFDDLYRNTELRATNSHLNMEGMEVNWVVYISQCDLRIK
jgi:hypothetical protein